MTGWIALAFLIGLVLTGDPAGRVRGLLIVLGFVVFGIGLGITLRFFEARGHEWAKQMLLYLSV